MYEHKILFHASCHRGIWTVEINLWKLKVWKISFEISAVATMKYSQQTACEQWNSCPGMSILDKKEYVDNVIALGSEVYFVLEHYFTTKLFGTVCAWFQMKFGNGQALHNTTMKCVVDCFHMKQTTEPKKCSGRSRTAYTKEMNGEQRARASLFIT